MEAGSAGRSRAGAAQACQIAQPHARDRGVDHLDSLSLTQVVEQPLHRALGLTDGELERIRELLGRDPNHFELAVFSLLWSEHCALQAFGPPAAPAAVVGPARAPGPGRERGRDRPRRGRGGRVQGREPQPPVRGRALPGRGHRRRRDHPRHRRHGRAAGRAAGRAPLRRAGLALRARGRGDRPLRELRRHPDRRRRHGLRPTRTATTASSTRCASGSSRPTASPAPARARPGTPSSSSASTTGRDGIGGASVLASQELGEESHEKRPSVQIGDPFTGKKLIETSLELVEGGLVESLQDLGAAGLASSLVGDGARRRRHRRPPRPRPAARGRDGAVGDHDLREPGADGRRRAAGARSTRSRRSASAGSSPYAEIGEVTDTGELRCFFEGEVVGAIPARYLTDEAPRYEVPRTPAAAGAGRARRRRAPRTTRRCSSCCARRTSAAAPGSTTATTTWSARARSRRPGLDAAVLRLRPVAARPRRLARRDRAACAASTRGPAARPPCSRRRGTSPAPAASRSRFTDCLNFGNPEQRRDRLGARGGDRGHRARRARRSALPIVSGNVSLYNETDGRPIYPTPEVGCVGLVADVRLVPGRWREGDAIFLAGASRARHSPAPSTRRSSARSAGRPRRSTSPPRRR